MTTMLDLDAEFEALTATLGGNPTDLPDWLTDDEPQEGDIKDVYRPRHAARYCPWIDVVVPEPTNSVAVEAAATTAMLNLPVSFIKSPTAKHAHDGTALAMIDHAADVIRASLARRSVPRRILRDLLGKLEAMR